MKINIKIKKFAKYRCPQTALYLVCRKGWANAAQQLERLNELKGLYTQEFIDERLLAIENAEKIPNFDTRVAAPRTLRTHLVTHAQTCTDKYVLLQAYIDTAFPVSERKIMYDAAGRNDFVKANQESWGSVKGMNTSMITFIEEHQAILAGTTPGDNMPADFKSKVEEGATAFSTTLTEYLLAEETQLATERKMDANNLIYAELMAMCKDARKLFRRNTIMSRLFVFDRLLFSVAPTLARFRTTFIDEETNMPIDNVRFILRSPDAPEQSLTCNAKGTCDFGVIESGDDYTGDIIPPPEYMPVMDIPISVARGSNVRKKYKLKRAA